MSNDNDRRKPYSGSRTQGAGRRTYPDAAGSGPRVGRIERNVPRAQRVDGEDRAAGSNNSTLHTPHATLHRGSAYRGPVGAR